MQANGTADGAPVRRIAVVLQNRARLGTLVCHIPLISSLRLRHPDAHLTVAAPFPEAGLLVADGLADALVHFPRDAWGRLRVVRALRADLLLTLRPMSIFITLLVGLSGARARIGFDSTLARLLFTAVRPRDLGIYRALSYLQLLEPLGVAPRLSDYLAAAAAAAPAAIDPSLDNVCLMPGGAAPFKLWGIDNFLALAARLRAARPDTHFVFVLGPGERALRERIDAAPLAAASTVLDTPSLGAIAQAVLASRVTVANDCGPSHVAQLLGRPYVCVFANHLGQAERVARQWFFSRPGARWLSGPPGVPITELPPAAVERCVEAVRPAAAAPPPGMRRGAGGGTRDG